MNKDFPQNQAVESTPLMFFAIQPDGRIIHANNCFCETFGYDRTEVIHRNYLDLFIPETGKTSFQNELFQLQSVKKDFSIRHNMRMKDESLLSIEWSGAVVENANDCINYIFFIGNNATETARLKNELIQCAMRLEDQVEERTQEMLATNEELTALNQEIVDTNEALQKANIDLNTEVSLRKQKEHELALREKQYRAITRLLVRHDEDFDSLLQAILREIMHLTKAPMGNIALENESGKTVIIRYSIGADQGLYIGPRSVELGAYGEVKQTGEILRVPDYQEYPRKIIKQSLFDLRTMVVVPIKIYDQVEGAFTVAWSDAVHQISDEEMEILRQFSDLASIALERVRANTKISFQNQLLQGLSETTAALVNELDVDIVLQNILNHASAFMGIPNGFIQFFDPDGRHAVNKNVIGRCSTPTGNRISFDEKGISAEVFRTGKLVVVEDYAAWPNRLAGSFYDNMTFAIQAPLNIAGRTIGSIGLTVFEEKFSIDQQKVAIFEQYATVASIAIKNALSHQESTYLAFHDILSGLPNRAFLNQRLEEEMEAARTGHAVGTAMFIDLDDLKMVNDNFGHPFGDNVIILASKVICAEVGSNAFVARVGGDEFFVILPGENRRDEIAKIAGRLVSSLHREYEIEGQRVHMSASVGVTLYPDDGNTVMEIMKTSDTAMYAAKSAGRNCWRFYQPLLLQISYDRMIMTNNLRYALSQNELTLLYQPQIELVHGQVVGFEALLRWNSHELGAIPPGRFIPLAEQSGLIQPIGAWVIQEASRFAHALKSMGKTTIHVAVNVSPRQLADENFVSFLRDTISESGIESYQLEIEITENILIESLEDSIEKLTALSLLGVRLSLDDFGTGFSSLTYLRSLPVKTLKIDKSFVDKIFIDELQTGFIRSIIDMAHVLGLSVVAEGVETELQLSKLKELGCDIAQGYWFSRPIIKEDAIRYLSR